jgi:hypothetical protein
MRNKKNKYASLPAAPVQPIGSVDSPLVLHFSQPSGRTQKIDLSFFEDGAYPRPPLAKVCAEVIWLDMQNCPKDTREGAKDGLKSFNRFLNWRAEKDPSRNITSTEEIDAKLLIEFQAYLAVALDISEVTANSYYLRLTGFIARIRKHRPERLQPNLKIPGSRFKQRDERSTSKKIISLSDLKLIEAAALKEVNEIRENHSFALKALDKVETKEKHALTGRKPKGYWRSVENVLHHLVFERDITKPVHELDEGLKKRSLPTARRILGWYAPTSDSYFVGFLILLYIRTLINVTSIYKLKRDCLEENPLPLGVTTLRFKKPRAGARANQELSFPTKQRDGAVELIKFLLEYTKTWVEYANSAEKNSLFLFRSRFGVRVVGHQCSQAQLPLFIERHDLPHFSFDQLRPTIATLIYLQTRDVFRVQRLLGHANVRTTIRYIKGPVVKAQHDQQMNEGIGLMIEAVTGIPARNGAISVFHDPVDVVVTQKVAEGELTPEAGAMIRSGGCRTLMGRCRDPLNSPQPGEIKGRVCRSLHACLTCENCWIFAGDLPDVIRYRDDLIADKAEMSDADWNLFHGDAVREINDAILTSFPTDVVANAELKAKRGSTPTASK